MAGGRTQRQGLAILVAALGMAVLPACSLGRTVARSLDFFARGDVVELRDDASRPARADPGEALLVLALDGVGRDVLYDLLRTGRMPELAALLGAGPEGRGRAHLEPSLVAALPSSTAVAWATAMTGEPPARHGIVGNEFFLRDERRLVAPVPASVEDPADTLAVYTDGLVNELLRVPTVYERMRERDPNVRVWVAFHQVFRGADVLLLPDRVAILDASRVMLQEKLRAQLGDEDAARVYEQLDTKVVETVLERLANEPEPEVLTIYLPGTDLYAHVAREGPDAARRRYLTGVVDPLLGKLAQRLAERGALEDRWVVVTSDHGHTEVVHDDHHSLGVDEEGEPEQVLRRAGFQVRPFQLGSPEDDDFDAVLAYQGALAYVYLADRSSCIERGKKCDWKRPARFDADVLEAADAFHRTTTGGLHASQLVDSLEMVLVRMPDPGAGELPFHVYVGQGRTEPVARYLAAHPRPAWVDFERRLRDLVDGPAGPRVGDLILISRAGDEWPLEKRRYFAPPYRSYHGSPSGQDSRIPLVVGHLRHSGAEAARRVGQALGGKTGQDRVAEVLLELRYGGDVDQASDPSAVHDLQNEPISELRLD